MVSPVRRVESLRGERSIQSRPPQRIQVLLVFPVEREEHVVGTPRDGAGRVAGRRHERQGLVGRAFAGRLTLLSLGEGVFKVPNPLDVLVDFVVVDATRRGGYD